MTRLSDPSSTAQARSLSRYRSRRRRPLLLEANFPVLLATRTSYVFFLLAAYTDHTQPSSTLFIDYLPPDIAENAIAHALRECLPVRIKLEPSSNASAESGYQGGELLIMQNALITQDSSSSTLCTMVRISSSTCPTD